MLFYRYASVISVNVTFLARTSLAAQCKLASVTLNNITKLFLHHTYHCLNISFIYFFYYLLLDFTKGGTLLILLTTVFSSAQKRGIQWSSVNTYRLAGWMPGYLRRCIKVSDIYD